MPANGRWDLIRRLKVNAKQQLYVQRDYVEEVPVILRGILQRKSRKPYGPLTSVTWYQLLGYHTTTGTSTALIAERQ